MWLYNLQYLVSGALSLFVSLCIILERPRTLALKYLFLFGLVTSLWEISNFFSRTAPDAVTAANFFTVVLITSHLCYPFYLLTVLNIREKRNRNILALMLTPAIIQIIIMLQKEYFVNYELFQTEFGWSYKVVSYHPSLIVTGLIFIGYLAGIIVILFGLASKTRFPLLKKKYRILFFSFTFFQVIGTTLLNAMLAMGFLNPNVRIGGVLQFLTFLSIWYVLSLKGEKIPSFFTEKEDFSQVYSSFLTVFYNSVIGNQLGEETFKFADFIKGTKIQGRISFEKNKIIFEGTEDLDIAELISRDLKFFDEVSVDEEVIDCYLRVLNAADRRGLGWKFNVVVKENEEFLKRSDLIYGISGGKFIRELVEDKSLEGLNDIDACLKIYKRILLTVVNKIQAKDEFRKRLSRYNILRNLEITDYDEILMKEVKNQVLKVPEDQRLPLLIESFNSVLSWAYEKILSDANEDIDDILSNLRLVLTLNKDRAVDLGIYPTLLGILATKIPRAQIHKLYSDYLEELVEEKTRELKKAHENLLKSQRLAAIGEVAAMVGHDLRNPLQAIVYSLHLAKRELESFPNSNLKEIMGIIEEQVEYMNKIVSDLQCYARPIKPNIVKTNLKEIIGDILSAIRVPKKIEVLIDVEDVFTEFPIDPLLIKRVLTNLIMNAIQAMEDKDKGLLKISAYKKDENAFISVQDTGVGIPEENLEKIFQPLFTTKAKGQGLGLAVCKRIIEALKGNITFESKVGEGTTFTIKLPFKPDSSPKVIISKTKTKTSSSLHQLS